MATYPESVNDVLAEEDWADRQGSRFDYHPGFEGVECPGDDRCECEW